MGSRKGWYASRRDKGLCPSCTRPPETGKVLCSFHRNQHQNSNRKTRSKVTPEQYFDTVAAQGNACAICRRTDRVLAADHDHKIGVFRGVLCRQCNSALGLFGDNPELLRAALRYLKC